MKTMLRLLVLSAVNTSVLWSTSLYAEPISEYAVPSYRKQAKTMLPVEGLRLFIKTNKRVYSPGENIVLTSTLTNTGKESTNIERTSSLYAYLIELSQPNGLKADLSPRGMETRRKAPSHISTLLLNPGQSFPATFNLNELFDMTTPGTYKVFVRRVVNSKKNFLVFVDVPSDAVLIRIM